MKMLYFVVTITAVKNPNQRAVIKLCVKKELIMGVAQVNSRNFLLAFYIS